ncbi:unnamed protein product [Adineta steineri]|uniref:Cytochrome P450 n=1 Tax=Adineta steineri TaxID=433720 RepID=A0A819KLW3_9BILA|nr:unnamed protein product [Adineta steineri]CAF1395847.1 unnamed protein product [Adineta steineri]CAF3947509.1 unnamed protein product [Adineta steineri]
MPFELTIWLSVGAVLLAILLIVAFVRRKHSYFVAANIPGPPPTFLLGNLGTLWQASHYFRQLESWTHQYGKVYGMFEGTAPIYVVSDVDFLEQVFITQFAKFDRRKPLLFLLPGQEKRLHVFDANGPTWRRQRYILNPAFSKAKLTQMLPLINGCVDEFVQTLASYADENVDVDVCPMYFRMTVDTIFRCAFSFDTDVQRNLSNPYLTRYDDLLSVDARKLFFAKLATALPALGGFILQIFMRLFMLLHKLNKTFSFVHFPEMPLLWLLDHIGEHVIRVRTEENEIDRVDLLHIMLDAATDQSIVDEEAHCDEDISTSARTPIVKKLTINEILGNVFIFGAAGTETTANILSYCTYILATDHEVQQKLQDEIDANIDSNVQSPTYEMIDKLEYLDMFIKEVNRMYPVGPIALTRLCMQDTTIGQYTVKKGTVVQVDPYSIHYDVDLWGPVDPYKFYPERHATKRHPLAYVSFGAGPRSCVGIRFAMMEIKMTCVRLLKTFTILKCGKLESNFQIHDRATIKPEAVWVKFEHRKQAD